jgi:hypothetical protein
MADGGALVFSRLAALFSPLHTCTWWMLLVILAACWLLAAGCWLLAAGCWLHAWLCHLCQARR